MPDEKFDSTSKQHFRFSDVIWRGTQALSLLAFFSFSHSFGIFYISKFFWCFPGFCFFVFTIDY